MKKIVFLLVTLLVSSGALLAADEHAGVFPPPLLAFSAAKEQQVRALATNLHLTVSPEINGFFKSAARGDYTVVTNTIARLAVEYVASYKNPAKLPAWCPFWQPMTEVESAYTAFATGGTKYPLAFGQGIIRSIPAGSIYFGGTDAGRGLVTALCESHAQARPFYTLTQNALSDGRYMDYLRAMYVKWVYLPTTNDVQHTIEEYKADALVRLKHDEAFPAGPRQIQLGEQVRMVDGKLEMEGPVSVMAIHARLVKLILDHNPNRDLFMEESYPLDLINPHLTPHGLIFKLNHEPLPALTAKIMEDDHAFWAKQCAAMLGGWLKPDTSVSNVCAFVETVYLKKDYSHFTGDREFVTNEFATKSFSKLRSSIAGLYQWRLTEMPGNDDKARLRAAADFGYRQAFALCPSSQEAIYRYINFLLAQGRCDDAIAIAGAALKLNQDNQQLKILLPQLQDFRDQQSRLKTH